MISKAPSVLVRTIAGLLLLGSASTLYPQGLLFSSGFETGEPGLGNWTMFGNAWVENGVTAGRRFDAYEGSYGLFVGAFVPPPGVAGAYRTFPTTPGTEYQWSGHVLNSMHFAVGSGTYGQGVIQFLGATGDVPLSSVVTADLAPPQNIWTSFSISGIAPPGAERVRFQIIVNAPEDSSSGGLFYDSVSAQVVPEVSPALWGTLVIVVAGAARRLGAKRTQVK